jgi:hypothetical protein
VIENRHQRGRLIPEDVSAVDARYAPYARCVEEFCLRSMPDRTLRPTWGVKERGVHSVDGGESVEGCRRRPVGPVQMVGDHVCGLPRIHVHRRVSDKIPFGCGQHERRSDSLDACASRVPYSGSRTSDSSPPAPGKRSGWAKAVRRLSARGVPNSGRFSQATAKEASAPPRKDTARPLRSAVKESVMRTATTTSPNSSRTFP